MIRSGVGLPAVGVACLVWVLDPKTVDFAINGMESALLVFFVALTWSGFVNGGRILPCALGLAGLQWTRPDGCVLFGVIAVAWLLAGATSTNPSWQERARSVIRAGAVGGLLYLPWLAFAWLYYGSPVPHTILAKVSGHGPGELAQVLLLYPWRLVFGDVALHGIFLPAYHFFGGWPWFLEWLARIVATGAALAWLVPRLGGAGRVASLALFLGGFYVEYIPRSPWYYPGWQALAFVTWAYLADAAFRAERSFAWIRPVARIAAAVALLLQGALLVGVAWQMRTQQRVVEDGNRREIGLWLKAHAAKGDRVYLEPLGYIGFYSGLKMLDYPGLASPEVVGARQAGHETYAQIVTALQPEWLVLRPDQVARIQREAPSLLAKSYQVAKVFDVRESVAAVPFLPGRPYLDFDALFVVFERVRAGATAP